MRLRKKHIALAFGLILMAIVGIVIYLSVSFKPFDFGPCDGNGDPDRYEIIYYKSGQVKKEGQLKNCVWNGLVKTYFETGELKSEEQRSEGRNHGVSIFYYPNGELFKKEEYQDGELIKFRIISQDSNLQYQYTKSNRLLSVKDAIKNSRITFTDSLILSGYDTPLATLKEGNLILRGKKDFYLINPNLEIEIDLRDTIMKYIPVAYDKKVDNSGNTHDFLWHRRIKNDSLKLKIFYMRDEKESVNSTWEKKYKLY